MSELPTMAHVWLEIAGMVLKSKEPFICNRADELRDAGSITDRQHKAILSAVDKERKRQNIECVPWGNTALWRGIPNYSTMERVVRIQFCTEQIRRLAR